MAGYNHFPSCTCPYCVGGWSQTYIIETADKPSTSSQWPGSRATYETYTDPNALCPVCGVAVFFYQSPSGGSVFFDELGPPWPKHPCTDNKQFSLFQPRRKSMVGYSAKSYAWERDGWTPVIIESVTRIQEWSWVKCRRLDRNGFFTRSTPWREELVPGTPAQVKPLDCYGVGSISWAALSEYGPKIHHDLLVHYTFGVLSVQMLKDAIAGNISMAALAGRVSSFEWGKKHPDSGDTTFPDFVSWPISKAWLLLAAEGGSKEAKILLADPIWNTVKWKG